MNNLKFIRQRGFGNRRIEFLSAYRGIRKGTVVDGTSVPKKGVFIIALTLSYLAYIGFLSSTWIVSLPLAVFAVIMPESNGLFFTSGAKHDVKYQSANSLIIGKISADWEFLTDMLKSCNVQGCSIYTRIVGVFRALCFYAGVVVGGWIPYWKYYFANLKGQ